MQHDDDLDDFSHLPSVGAAPSAEEKKALWKQHSRAQPEHTHREEVLEEQLLAHELPVEQEFAAEEHTNHTPEWAEESYVAEEPAAQLPAAAPQAEVQDWVREAFEMADDPPPVKEKKKPVLLPLPKRPAPVEIAPALPSADSETADAPVSEAKSTGKSEPKRDSRREEKRKEKSAAEEKLPPRADDPPEPKKDKAGKVDAGGKDKPKSDEPHKTIEVPHGLPHEPEPELGARERFKQSWEKIGGRALAASVAMHIILLVTAATVYITVTQEKDVDFLPGGGSKGAAEAAQSKQFKVQQKKNTWLKNKPLQRVVSTSAMSTITLPDAPPDMDFPDASKLIGSKGMSGGSGGFGKSGIGKGFGSGLGFGGKISFMGNSGVGRNIVFVVDVSASMSSQGDSGTGGRISRFDLLKRELVKTIGRLPPNTQYQVIYFSDFAWPHNEVDSHNLKAFEKYAWKISPDKTNARVPQFRYLAANSTNVLKSIELIKNADNPGGTNWGSGLFMALKGYPKPDIIFFMTDGNKIDAEGWVDEVSKVNLTGGKRTIIHTTAMMEPDAAIELDQLAKRNGGNFTIITAQGFTLTSDEFFKGTK